MPTREVTIASAVGLHARPASLFVQEVAKLGVKVTIAKAGGPGVDASSLLGVMSQGIKHGEVAVLTADGEGAEEALDHLAAFLAVDHDAPAS